MESPNRLLQTPVSRTTAQNPKSLLPLFLLVLVLQLITLTAALSLVLTQHRRLPRLEDPAAAYHAPAAVEPGPPSGNSVLTRDAAAPPAVPEVIPAPPTVPVAPTPLPAEPAVRLRGMEITQGIQVFNEPELARCVPDPTVEDNIFCNNSMPLIAGRHSMVRVFLACNGPCPTADTDVNLRILKDGQERATIQHTLPASALPRVSSLSMFEVRANLDNSVNFAFLPPPDWMEGQIAFQVEARPRLKNGGPAARLALTREFARRKPLRIAYLPVESGGVEPANPQDAGYWLLRMYPVSAVEYYRLPVPDLEWDSTVSKSDLLRKLLFSFWFYAQSQTPENRPDQLFGWLPQQLYNGGASDPFWCPNCAGPHSSRVAFGGSRPERDIGGPRILVHEIAHNLGAQHAWSPTFDEDNACFKGEGVDIRVDPTWPYPHTPHIQEFGIDLYSDPPVVYPPSYYDMMAYCAQPWISPHTYRKLFDSPFLQPQQPFEPSLFTDFSPQVETTQAGTLLVSGVIYPNGTVDQPQVLKLDADAFGSAVGFAPPPDFNPPSGDDYCLDIEAADGRRLSQRCFDAGFIDLETGQPTEPASFFISVPGINPDEVGRVTIRKNQLELASTSASNSPPQIELNFPAGGELLAGPQTITWDAVDPDGDRLTFDLFYSPDGGKRWLPLAVRLTESQYTFYTGQLVPGDNLRLKVMASDGFNTTVAQSPGSFSIRPLPENSINLTGPSTVQAGQTLQVSVAFDHVTEPGLFGAQLRLSFDPGLVQVTDVQVNPSFELVLDQTIDNSAGEVALAASRQGELENLTGHVALATLTLTAHQPGQLYLELFDVKAGARGGVSRPLSAVQGLSLSIAE